MITWKEKKNRERKLEENDLNNFWYDDFLSFFPILSHSLSPSFSVCFWKTVSFHSLSSTNFCWLLLTSYFPTVQSITFISIQVKSDESSLFLIYFQPIVHVLNIFLSILLNETERKADSIERKRDWEKGEWDLEKKDTDRVMDQKWDREKWFHSFCSLVSLFLIFFLSFFLLSFSFREFVFIFIPYFSPCHLSLFFHLFIFAHHSSFLLLHFYHSFLSSFHLSSHSFFWLHYPHSLLLLLM